MILLCAKLSALAYEPKAPHGFVNVDDLRYGVHNVAGKTIVTFRGTDPASLHNWMRDARIWPTRSCTGYLAHKGFVRGFQKLCSEGLPTAKGSDIIATGHSLGGAFATLLAEKIGCQAITFGAPRVYWRFGSAPKLQHTRIIRDDDPVPDIPFFTYSHRCDPVKLDDKDHSIFVQVQDHSMGSYVAALEKGGGYGLLEEYRQFLQELR